MPGCGHGHVYPEPNGVKARCGGPGLCAKCSRDQAQKDQAARAFVEETCNCGRVWRGRAGTNPARDCPDCGQDATEVSGEADR